MNFKHVTTISISLGQRAKRSRNSHPNILMYNRTPEKSRTCTSVLLSRISATRLILSPWTSTLDLPISRGREKLRFLLGIWMTDIHLLFSIVNTTNTYRSRTLCRKFYIWCTGLTVVHKCIKSTNWMFLWIRKFGQPCWVAECPSWNQTLNS